MSEALDDRDGPYQVLVDAGRYSVVSGTGITTIRCNDKASARHYAELLNRAFRSGYRAALRDRRDDESRG